MKQIQDVVVPELGADAEAYVVEWLQNVGDPVEEGKPLVEVMTDKANVEIPAPASGVLTAQLASPEQRIAVGQPIARIETID